MTNRDHPFDPREWKPAGRILGLCGYAKVGKDTIANKIGFPRAAFADALKEDLEVIIRERFGIDVHKCLPHEKSLIRPVMVEWGRLGRAWDPAHWIKRVRIPVRCKYEERMVISDVRYANEVQAIYDAGGVVVYLWDDGIEPANEEERQSFAELFNRFPDIPRVQNTRDDFIMPVVHVANIVNNHYEGWHDRQAA
jgi:hypothetical protein